MLPIKKALIGDLAHSGVIGTNVLPVVGCPPASSALSDIESSRGCPRLVARYYGLG
jgi:hypothetical protein